MNLEITMSLETVMQELENLGSDRTKKIYMTYGAKEPLFGVATGAMKPLAKANRNNQELAEQLYETGNYDAMYLAGMIADVDTMTPADFDRWMESAYFYMIGDFIVSVTLAETRFAQEVSDRWIASNKELYVSAGYNCYCWLIGNRKDHEFDQNKLSRMLDVIEESIHEQPARARYAMNNFVLSVGVSFAPLHEKALEVAESIGEVEVMDGKRKVPVANAKEEIMNAKHKGRVGFKRRNVRC